MSTLFVYSDKYDAYGYGGDHPLRMERLTLTYELCKAYGLFDLAGTRVVEASPASESQILRFHTPRYVEVLKLASCGEFKGYYTHGLGPGDNPIFAGLWDWSLLHTGATLRCAKEVSVGKARIAFNIAGGLHHAGAGRASGFCYVNDPAIAICHLVDQGMRVMYLDIDAHHGDGVQWAFYEDPRVLTVSFHQDGATLFPGTGNLEETGRGDGKGYAVNVPMLPGTDDEVFWTGFSAIVPSLMEGFRPDVVVSQLGVDAFLNDPLASLELTTNGFCRVISFLTERAPAWVALGGGGYEISNVARAWTLAWAIMNGVDLPDEIPDSFQSPLFASDARGRRLRDEDHVGRRREQCARRMEENIRYLERNALGGLG
ncbi:MAG: acetoin utilization protein AcuC [Deltaproteobacteria bacterium]|nr:acetoin utilization protein AcuC [Deltaproteobacteria bacterium]